MVRSVLALMLIYVAIAIAGAAPAGAITFASSGYESVTLAGGLTQPTAVTYAPDGTMFIAEKQGYVREVTRSGRLLGAPIFDISRHVTTSGDRGLLGIAADKDFATNHYLYLLYTYGNPTVPREATAVSRLTRITVGGPPSETVVAGSVTTSPCTRPPSNTQDCIPSDGYTHSIGTVRVDPVDGSLWFGVGDAQADDKAYADAVDALNPSSLAGKILHVDQHPAHLGQGLAGHPFCAGDGDLTHTCTKVYAEGFRNPFRFTLRQVGGVSRPIVSDVGWGHWEEINDVSPGYSGGWPCFEAGNPPDDYQVYSPCTGALSPPNSLPLYQYSHFTDDCSYPATPPPNCNRDSIGGAAVAGPLTSWPSGSGAQRVYFTDYVHGFLKTLDPTAPPPRGKAPDFATGLGHAVFLDQIPRGAPGAGNLVYVVIGDDTFSDGSGSVHEIRRTAGNVAPVPSATASASCGAPGLTVRFGGDGSTDPDGNTPLTYRWDFGDGSSAKVANPSHRYARAGDYIARLTVTDRRRASQSAFLPIAVHVGAQVPTATVAAPQPGDQYLAGAATHISGNSPTPGSTWTWEVLLNHAGSHVHVAGAFDVTEARANPMANGGTDFAGDLSFLADRGHGVGSFYVLRFTVSKGGCTKTITRTMAPQRGGYDLSALDDQTPANALHVPLTFAKSGDEQINAAPARLLVAKRALASVSAPATFRGCGTRYTFAGWSDGGARVHGVTPYQATLTDDPESLTARYKRTASPPAGRLLRLTSVPRGAALSFNGAVARKPSVHTLAPRRRARIGAPATRILARHVYLFSRWCDGGARNHVLIGDGTSTTLTATYARDRAKPQLTVKPAAGRPSSLAGSAKDPGGVASVRVALRPAQPPHRGCPGWSPGRRRLVATRRSCKKPVFYGARLSGRSEARSWRLKLGRALPRGDYLLVVVARDRNRNATTQTVPLSARR